MPPRWIVEPADVSVERNRHVTLHCQAQGVPMPAIVWKKATGIVDSRASLSNVHRENLRAIYEISAVGSKSGDYEEIREKPFTKLLANGSLLLQHVKEDREGFYLCQAHNGIGTGIGKVIQLKVNCKWNWTKRVCVRIDLLLPDLMAHSSSTASPYFSAPSRIVTVKKGDTAVLRCEVSGDKPINVVWLRAGKHELNPTTNYR